MVHPPTAKRPLAGTAHVLHLHRKTVEKGPERPSATATPVVRHDRFTTARPPNIDLTAKVIKPQPEPDLSVAMAMTRAMPPAHFNNFMNYLNEELPNLYPEGHVGHVDALLRLFRT